MGGWRCQGGGCRNVWGSGKRAAAAYASALVLAAMELIQAASANLLLQLQSDIAKLHLLVDADAEALEERQAC